MKQFKIFCCLLVLPLAFSCSKKDDVIADTDKPVITLISPASSAKVNGTVSITATVTDNDGLNKVQVYLDNTLLQEFADGNVNLNWDSKTVSDGAHTIKVTATDKSANVAEGSFSVTVRNTLIEFAVPAGYINATSDYWIFLSDKSGKIWDTKQLLNGQTYKFNPTTNFQEDSITLSIFQYNPNQFSSSSYITTYANIPFNKYRFATPVVGSTQTPVIIGTAKLQITDGDDQSYANMSFNTQDGTNFVVGIGGQVQGLDCTINLVKDHNPVLIIDKNDANQSKYLYFDAVPNLNLVKTRAADFSPLTSQSIGIPNEVVANGNTDGFLNITGKVNGKFLYSYYNSGITDPTSVKAYFPPNVLTSFTTNFRWSSDNGSVGYYVAAASIPSQMKTINGSILNGSIKGNTINYNATGTFDFVNALAGGYDDVSKLSITWKVNLGDKLSATIKVPEIPAEIKSKYSWAKSFYELNGSIVLNDYDLYKNYSELVTSDLLSDVATGYNEYTYTQLYLTATSGRLNTHKGNLDYLNPQPIKH